MSAGGNSGEARHFARLGAVQALYQMEMSGEGHETVLREFKDHRFGKPIDDMEMPQADCAHFERIVNGVIARQDEIDQGINKVLRAGWPLARLDATVRAILRAGAFELLACPDVPPKVALNEYVELASEFYSGEEPAFINGVLDGYLRSLRGAPESAAR
ncbi:MAG: transcription antitermination factor NusB [Alphaproteobacteria bacterium]